MPAPRRPTMVTAKHAIQTALMNYLYEPVRQRHRKQVEALIVKNCILTKTVVRAFRYKGDIYRSAQAPSGPLLAAKLHDDLAPELAQMIEEQQEIHAIEEPMVKGYITLVLNLSDQIDDFLLLFPQSVHRAILNLNLTSGFGPRVIPDEAAAAPVLEKHARCIQLIKERMVSNLIFQ